jgi:DNA-binding response OmpR family regulator
MPARGTPIKILLVRSWLHKLAPVRRALQEAGFAPTFIRTDIEPALNAALTRGGIDLVIFDPTLDGLSRETVLARCRELRPSLQVLALGDLGDLGARVRTAMLQLAN